jgi:hypothetical protein
MLNEAAFFETVLISELQDAPAERMVCFVGALSAARGAGGGGAAAAAAAADEADDGYILTLRDGSGGGGSDSVRVDTRNVIVPVCAPLALLRVHGVTRGGGGVPLVRATVLCGVEELDLAGWRSMLVLRRAVLARQGLLDAGSLGARALAAEAACASAAVAAAAASPAPAPAFAPPAGVSSVSALRARGRATWPSAAAGDLDSQSSPQPQLADASAASPPAEEAPRRLRGRPPRGGGSIGGDEHVTQPLAET